MAHELMNGNAYAGRSAAWHELGEVRPDFKTMTEMARAAGLTYEFVKKPLFFEVETLTDTWHHQTVGHSIMTKNGVEPLAVVSDEYEFMQPMEIAESLDTIIREGGWAPETALALGRGETTAMCLNLGGWSIDSDRVQDYLLVTDTVDAKHSLQICIVPTRVVCANTLRIGLQRASVRVNLRHLRGHRMAYGSAVERIVQAQNNVREALVALSKVPYTMEGALGYYTSLFMHPVDEPTSSKGVAQAVRMGDLIDSSMGFLRRMVAEQGLPLNAWAAFNGASEAIEHSGLFGGRVSTRKSMLMGTGRAAEMVQRAYELVRHV
jgi:phage/plasmid-like protein (TIGR03299 family)